MASVSIYLWVCRLLIVGVLVGIGMRALVRVGHLDTEGDRCWYVMV